MDMPVIQPRICWFSSWICFPTLPQCFLYNPFQWWPSGNQPFQSPIPSCWGPWTPGSPALHRPRVQDGEGSAEHRPFRGDPSSLRGAAGGGSQVRGSHPTTVYTWRSSLITSLAGESYAAHTAFSTIYHNVDLYFKYKSGNHLCLLCSLYLFKNI